MMRALGIRGVKMEDMTGGRKKYLRRTFLHNFHSLAKYYQGERMKKDDMDRSYRTRVVI
jgi:hypothetical protein